MVPDPDFEDTLIHTCTIKVSTKSNDSRKNPVVSYDSDPTTYNTRRVTIKADSRLVVSGVVYDADFKFYFTNLVCKETDIIVCDSKEYRVHGIEEYPDDEGTHHYEVYAKRLSPSA